MAERFMRKMLMGVKYSAFDQWRQWLVQIVKAREDENEVLVKIAEAKEEMEKKFLKEEQQRKEVILKERRRVQEERKNSGYLRLEVSRLEGELANVKAEVQHRQDRQAFDATTWHFEPLRG
eukprot:CAMPEP_0198224300 /NCGR_PEP_ID=MMETSP1445-20131203/96323_1 /TAXON_ID=36898 /ORGANISM="Pyramimonas sp., Strain CCMP2087" /LENGTH=120 /DNA_ID=CAMNT_0043903423 /DNA_START=30 /DNA_END=388 /DNA_ORIENTATION=-